MKSSRSIRKVMERGIPAIWMQNTALIQVYAKVEHTGLDIEVVWKRSKIKKAGNGCFTRQAIKKDDIIRQGVDGMNLIAATCASELPLLTESTYKYLEHFAYTINENDDTVYLWIPPNGINHSLEPNIQSDMIDGGIETIALRDIEEGEELTANYTRFRSTPPDWFREVMQERNTLYDFLASIPR